MLQLLLLRNATENRLFLAMKLGVLLTLAMMLAACGTSQPASVTNGACNLFSAPRERVYGLDPYSQQWADAQIEVGVGVCQWERPKDRPKPQQPVAPIVGIPAPEIKSAPPSKLRDWFGV